MFSVIDHVMRFAGQRTRSKPSLAAHSPWARSHGEMGSQVPPALQGLGGLGSSAFCQPGGCVVSSPGNSQGPTVTTCPCPQVTRAASACCASCRITSSRPSPTVAFSLSSTCKHTQRRWPSRSQKDTSHQKSNYAGTLISDFQPLGL